MKTTHKFYFFYVSDIEVDTEMEQSMAYVGEEISLDGIALYNGNESAPVEYSDVSSKIVGTGTEKNSTTDVEGKFNIGFIFDDPGDYQINTTVTNRTLVGYDEITVSVVPLSISYVSEFVQLTSCYPNDEIWVNGTCRYNSGEAVANSDVVVRINKTHFWEGETDSSGNYSVLILVPGETGLFSVNVSVINGTLIGFNETTISVTEIPIPDLVIQAEDISFVSNKTPSLKHDVVCITVKVRNLGSANCTTIMMTYPLLTI